MTFEDDAVEAVFAGFPDEARAVLLTLRARIFAVAEAEGVGPLNETLRWGQPAYLTPRKAGSTIRLGVSKRDGYVIYTHCQTSIMSDFRAIAPELDFEGNRAVHFEAGTEPPLEALDFLFRRALTYHL